MNAAARQLLSALVVVAFVMAAASGAALTVFSLRARQAEVATLMEQVEALQAREKRLSPQIRGDLSAAPSVRARTITLAGATLQQRFESAVANAKGRLISSKVDLATRGDVRRLTLAAELTIAESDMQSLLFDIETGRPYLFIDSLEARATEPSGAANPDSMRVSIALSGQWGGAN